MEYLLWVILKHTWHPRPASSACHDGGEGHAKKLLVIKVSSILGETKDLLDLLRIPSNVPAYIGLQKPWRKNQELGHHSSRTSAAALEGS